MVMDKNITVYLDDLKDIIMSGKKPMFGGGRIVDEHICIDILERIEDSLPQALKEAKYIIRDCQKLRGDAERDAQEIIAEAEERASQMVSKHSIVKAAEEEAHAIIGNAQRYATKLDYETKYHIDKVLSESEEQLAEFLQIIRESREDLKASIIKEEK